MRDKEKQSDASIQNTSDNSTATDDRAAETIQTPSPKETAAPKQFSHKELNILNLMQVIVRYGEKVIYQTTDNQPICAGEYIIQIFRGDDVIEQDSLIVKQNLKYAAPDYDPRSKA